jgi:hypothetical protein
VEKKRSLILLFCFCLIFLEINPVYSQVKISELPASTVITDDDLMIMVDNPSGTPASKQITFGNIKANIALPPTVQSVTCTDSGNGSPGALTITPTAGVSRVDISLTVSDADGCTITMAETAAVEETEVLITNISAANTATFTTSAGVLTLKYGSPLLLEAKQSLRLVYKGSEWLETARTGGISGITFGGFTASKATCSNGSGNLVSCTNLTDVTPAILGANTFTADQTISTHNIITDTSTGSKIGTATNQKLGFFNSTPVVQQTGDLVTALSNLGLVVSGTTAGGGETYGYQSWSAGGLIPDTCSGLLQYKATNNQFDYLSFDGASDQYATFVWFPPDNWDRGTILAKFIWAAGAAMTDAQTIIWGLAGYTVRDGDTLNKAINTGEQGISDAYATGNETGPIQKITAKTPAITIDGTHAAGNPVYFRVHRDADTDTSTAAAWLLGVRIQFTKTTETAW